MILYHYIIPRQFRSSSFRFAHCHYIPYTQRDAIQISDIHLWLEVFPGANVNQLTWVNVRYLIRLTSFPLGGWLHVNKEIKIKNALAFEYFITHTRTNIIIIISIYTYKTVTFNM